MPPRAIASHVCPAIDKACGDPVRAWCRSRNSSTIDGGNFGAPPKPPVPLSKSSASAATAAAVTSASGRSPVPAPSPDRAEAFSARAAAIRSDSVLTFSLFDCQASATAVTSCTNCGRGKYVPAKKGSPSGVMKTVIGQPPWPRFIAWVAAM